MGFDSNRITKLQKRRIRIITRSTHNAHTQPLMKQLTILSVPDMLLLNSMKFYYEYKRNEVPDYFTSFNLHTQDYTTIFVSYNSMTSVRCQANILNHSWDVNKGIILDISVRPETKWNNFIGDIYLDMLCTKRWPHLPGLGVLEHTHLYQYSFCELWLYVRRHVTYCDWWVSWQRLNALMIVDYIILPFKNMFAKCPL